jgi:hypothetical protein
VPNGVSVIAYLAAYIPLVKAGPRIMANGVPGFSRNIIWLDRCARAVKRQHATDDGVRGFMTGGVSASLRHLVVPHPARCTTTAAISVAPLSPEQKSQTTNHLPCPRQKLRSSVIKIDQTQL